MREKAVEGYRGFRGKITVLFIYFLAMPHSSQNFSSRTRDPTQVLHSGSTESYPLTAREVLQRSFLKHSQLFTSCSFKYNSSCFSQILIECVAQKTIYIIKQYVLSIKTIYLIFYIYFLYSSKKIIDISFNIYIRNKFQQKMA